MHKAGIKRESGGAAGGMLALLLGGLLSLGIELMVLLVGSFAGAAGVFRVDAVPQLTAAACLIGCFFGGRLTCSNWKHRRVIGGTLTGVVCFLFILLIALIWGRVEFGTQSVIELAGCIIGGCLAGVLAGRRKKNKRKKGVPKAKI